MTPGEGIAWLSGELDLASTQRAASAAAAAGGLLSRLLPAAVELSVD